DPERAARARVRELDRGEVKERPVETEALEQVTVRRRVSVAAVAEHRLSDRREPAADRARSPGLRAHLEERVARQHGEPAMATRTAALAEPSAGTGHAHHQRQIAEGDRCAAQLRL